VGKGVKLKPYQPRAYLPRQYLTENEIRSYSGSDIILDGEYFPNFSMMGFKHVQSGKYFRLDYNFNPHLLSWIINSFRSVGFNSITYDLVMLWAMYINQQPAFLKSVSDYLIRGARKEEVEKEFNFKCYPLQPRQHIDLFNVCPLKGSLKLYGARLHSPRIQDLPFPDYEPLSSEQVSIVQEYNCNDLDVTEQIFKFCKERLELRESISLEYNLDLMSKSDAQMAEAVIAQEVSKLNGRYVKRPEIDIGHTFKYRCPQYIRFATPPMIKLLEKIKRINFQVDHDGRIASPKELEEPAIIGKSQYVLGIGGLHSKNKCIGYETKDDKKIKTIDVRSYYPNAIINLELMPIAMGPNFLVVYKHFKDSREDAKARKLFTKDKGLKIFLNGGSGKWSDPWSKLYSPWNTIHMNLTGQLLILMLAEMLTCRGMEVISANTDGLEVYYKEEDSQKLAYWIKYWEDMTGFVLEGEDYLKYYARDVNAYFAVKDDKSVKVKGPYSEVGSQSGTQLDNNPNMLICSDAIKLFLSNGTPIETTIFNCKDITRFVTVRNVKGGAHKDGNYLGKVVRWAYYKKCYGTINYILSGNKVPDTDGAMPLQDLPSEFPAEQIDYQYYINAAKEILTDIGYYQKAKQVVFF
jgi:hypothetical protein